MQRNHTFRSTEIVLLQRQLFDVQENVRTETKGDDQGIWETREEDKGTEGPRTVQEASREYMPYAIGTRVQSGWARSSADRYETFVEANFECNKLIT